MNEPQNQRRAAVAEAGFTLVEIMVVIVIIGLLATIVARNVMSSADEAKIKTAEVSVKNIAGAIQQYYIFHGKLPDNLELLVSSEVKGGPYLDELNKDPWEHDFILRGETKNDYEVICLGPDGTENTEDDITSRKKKE